MGGAPAGGVACLRRTVTTTKVAASIGISACTLEKRRIYSGAPGFLKLGRSLRERTEKLNANLGESGRRLISESRRRSERALSAGALGVTDEAWPHGVTLTIARL